MLGMKNLIEYIRIFKANFSNYNFLFEKAVEKLSNSFRKIQFWVVLKLDDKFESHIPSSGGNENREKSQRPNEDEGRYLQIAFEHIHILGNWLCAWDST